MRTSAGFHGIPWLIVFVAILAILVWGTDEPSATPVKGDERVILFDVAAHRDAESGKWVAPLHGWIFEPSDSVVRLRAIEEVLAAAIGRPLPEGSRERFEGIVRGFLVDNERGKRIAVEIGEESARLGDSLPNGQFRGTVELPADAGPGPLVARTTARDGRTFEARVHLVPPEGISVVSDLDDTVKISEVGDLGKLLAHTFYEEARAVPGMAEVYRRWADDGATFHYVSSSPWHLVEPITAFLDDAGVPRTTLSLKDVRLKDESILDLFRPGTESKPEAIRPLLERFPARRFVLVGDTGEEDPEVYAALAAEFPERIVGVYLRNVSDASRDDARFAPLDEAPGAARWRLFADPSRLPASLSATDER